MTGKDLIGIVGPPCFLNGCTVTGDFAAMAAGRPTVLRLEARVSVSDDHSSVLIENFPPNANPDETATASQPGQKCAVGGGPSRSLPAYSLAAQGHSRPVLEGTGHDLLVCVPARGTAPEQLREQLRDVYGVYTTVRVAFPALAACLAQELGPGPRGRGPAD